jgi:L-glyceraldehyde 3-phosphate reductase
VQQGKALYIGISSYSGVKTREIAALLKEWKVPLLIHQPAYNLLNRWVEKDLLDTTEELGTGVIAFTPLAQGLLTDKYLNGVPADARVNRPGGGSLQASHLSEANIAHVRALNEIAKRRGQSLAQLALAWTLRDPRVTSALIGASRPEQIIENVGALKNLSFSAEELAEIDRFAQEGGINCGRSLRRLNKRHARFEGLPALPSQCKSNERHIPKNRRPVHHPPRGR